MKQIKTTAMLWIFLGTALGIGSVIGYADYPNPLSIFAFAASLIVIVSGAFLLDLRAWARTSLVVINWICLIILGFEIIQGAGFLILLLLLNVDHIGGTLAATSPYIVLALGAISVLSIGFVYSLKTLRSTEVREAVANRTSSNTRIALLFCIVPISLIIAASFPALRITQSIVSSRAQLQPLYQQKIDAISKRNPVEDAKHAWTEHTSAFLPSVPGFNVYAGIDGDRYFKIDESNHTIISNSKFLTEIQILLDDSELETMDPEHRFKGDVIRQYIDAKNNYQRSYNIEMYELTKGKQ